ncbi:hypothetical protein P4V72_04990 [Bacillus thuringiensis]|uniref:Uncharacterized protein n=1 Tax=Bacillus thuringiensis TaxID=1428 RepID=A0A9W3XM97_BACTU|nr:hypothetical protein [Bacillus thuringiensis]AQY42493.1 hypothetical protein B4918_31855 [Bacillus thuringiensis]MDR4148630.1 hypothetical protein [Bacillus thuringiensis]MEC3569978.1 hypothetical protein [Bacillus thuringiensis]MED2021622.1 hypothetical protein [Bacillus thuringiensis]MED2140568.1 hypothetical protein [Bacillus thuringiensis]
MKKIRGWKRRVRKLNEWKVENSQFDNKFFEVNHFDYVKTFNFLDTQDLPIWYKKKVICALVEVFQSWKSAAESKFNHFYLRLQINGNDLLDSQLIIALDEQIVEYKNKFVEYQTQLEKPLFLNNIALNWRAYHLVSIWLEDEINTLSATEKELLLNNLLEVRKVTSYEDENSNEYLIKDSVIWVSDYENIK